MNEKKEQVAVLFNEVFSDAKKGHTLNMTSDKLAVVDEITNLLAEGTNPEEILHLLQIVGESVMIYMKLQQFKDLLSKK